MDAAKVQEIIEKYRDKNSPLMYSLQDVQKAFNYLPKEALVQLSEGLNIPLSRVYAVASFFRAFSLKPRGKHVCNVCVGTACHVRGAQRILDKLDQELGIGPGETTPDMEFTVETVNCLGACALGPIMVVGEEYYGNMTTTKVARVLKSIREG
jgi:NADH-quinone oxidoreductase subunit E